jgi:hypothetical protein
MKLTKHIKTSTNDSIYVFDNVFKLAEVFSFEQFAEKSNYRICKGSLDIVNRWHETTIRCDFTEDDLHAMGILNVSGFSEISEYITHKKRVNAWLVLSTQASEYALHTDESTPNEYYNSGQTFLYFVNSAWDFEWGGEMLFCNTAGELEIAVSCKPNRAILFDCKIPHKSTRISSNGPPYRHIFIGQFHPAFKEIA